MLLDLTKLLGVLERIAVALEKGAVAAVAEIKAPKTAKPTAAVTTATSGATTVTAQGTSAANPTVASSTTLTIQQVADKFTAWGSPRQKAIDLLAHFGVPKLSAIKPESFPDVMAYMENNGPPAQAANSTADLLG